LRKMIDIMQNILVFVYKNVAQKSLAKH